LTEDYETGRARVQCVIPKHYESRYAPFVVESEGRKKPPSLATGW